MSKFNNIILNGSDILDIIYPIGTLYYTEDTNFDPNEKFNGAWELIKGAFIWSIDPDDSSLNTAKQTGGEREHTLIQNEMPMHNHAQYVTSNSGGPAIRNDYSADGRGILYPQGCSTGNAGGGEPHNNMPPYYTAYCWRRIS